MYGGVRGFLRPTKIASGTALTHANAHGARSDRLYNLYFAMWRNLSPLAVVTQEQLLKEG